jgi:hypothetical protein
MFMLDCLFVSLFIHDSSLVVSWWRTPRNDSSAACWLMLHGSDRALGYNKYAWTNATSMLYIEQPVERILDW